MDKVEMTKRTNEPIVPGPGWPSYPGYAERNGYAYGSADGFASGGLFDYVRILCRHKLVLLLITGLGVLAGLAVTLAQTSVYQGRVVLEIQDVNQNFLNVQQVNPISQANGYTALADLQTQAKLLESESLMKRALSKLKDRIPDDLKTDADGFVTGRKILSAVTKFKDDAFKAAGFGSSPQPNRAPQAVYKSTVARNPQKPRQETAAPRRLVTDAQQGPSVDDRIRSDHPSGPEEEEPAADLTEVARNLRVRPARQTRVLEVTYDSTDPRFAAAFVNTLAQEFIASNMEARWMLSQQTSEWLSHQLVETRKKLEQSDDALQAYARKSGLMFTSEKDNISEEKLRQVQVELSKAQADRTAAQSRWEISKTSPPDSLPDVFNDASLRSLQEKVTDLRRQEAELSIVFTDQHPKLRRIQAQIGPLEAALQRERSAVTERVGNEYRAALHREKLLQSDYAKQSRVVTDQGATSIQYNILKREADSNRQLYDSMLQRVKEASIASAMRASNVRIVDPALPPKRPYKPSLATNGALGLLAGLLLAFGFVMIRERSDSTLHAPGEAKFWLKVPELQAIPALASEDYADVGYTHKFKRATVLGLDAPQRAKARSIASGSLNRRSSAAEPNSVELVTWLRKPSLIAESFRSLLTSIMLSGENGDTPRVLVVTSASPGEGKSMVVSNLGIALAEIKRKVLIIDADLRKPRIHEIFGLPNCRGLNTLLEDSSVPVDGVEGAEGVVRETHIPGVFVLPSGPPIEGAMNLLYSAKLPSLLARFKQQFDLVILDTPPMLLMPDARVLGRMADGVILVIRAGRTMRDAALAASQRFSEDRIRILGTVLNDWDPKKTPGLYDYGSGHHYYHRAG